MLRWTLLALAAWALVGCPPAQTPDSEGEPLPPFPCQKDADCVAPACGPCTPGAVLLQQTRECAVNPCPNVAVACSPQKVCVVK
jgi:hypothetical protein